MFKCEPNVSPENDMLAKFDGKFDGQNWKWEIPLTLNYLLFLFKTNIFALRWVLFTWGGKYSLQLIVVYRKNDSPM